MKHVPANPATAERPVQNNLIRIQIDDCNGDFRNVKLPTNIERAFGKPTEHSSNSILRNRENIWQGLKRRLVLLEAWGVGGWSKKNG